MSNKIEKSWTDFKTLLVAKGAVYQIVNKVNDHYCWFYDGHDMYFCYVPKTTPKSTDQIDLEDNYLAGANKPSEQRTSDGIVKFSKSLAHIDLSLNPISEKATLDVNNTLVEHLLSYDIEIQGVEVYVENAEWGDTIKLNIGYYDVNSNWVQLNGYGEAMDCVPDSGWRAYKFMNYEAVGHVPAGLIVQIAYSQANTANTKRIIMHLIAHIAE